MGLEDEFLRKRLVLVDDLVEHVLISLYVVDHLSAAVVERFWCRSVDARLVLSCRVQLLQELDVLR